MRILFNSDLSHFMEKTKTNLLLCFQFIKQQSLHLCEDVSYLFMTRVNVISYGFVLKINLLSYTQLITLFWSHFLFYFY